MTVKTNDYQVGVSATASQNFTLSTPAVPDGTMKLARGNVGATTQDILAVGANNALSLPGDPAWTAGAVGVASDSGTVGNANCTYAFRRIGRTMFYRCVINILAQGTGAGAVNVALPAAAQGVSILVGRENGVTGHVLQGVCSGSTLSIYKYDNTTPCVTGYALHVSGCYETTTSA
jgi:hypothetical protein